MMGGIDIYLDTKASDSLEIAIRAIRETWPQAEFEDADTGEHYSSFCDIPFGKIEEIFVYQNHKVARIWDEKGAVPEVSNTMIHVLYDPGQLSIVVDERNDVMNMIVTSIESALADEIHYVPALLEAA